MKKIVFTSDSDIEKYIKDITTSDKYNKVNYVFPNQAILKSFLQIGKFNCVEKISIDYFCVDNLLNDSVNIKGSLIDDDIVPLILKKCLVSMGDEYKKYTSDGYILTLKDEIYTLKKAMISVDELKSSQVIRDSVLVKLYGLYEKYLKSKKLYDNYDKYLMIKELDLFAESKNLYVFDYHFFFNEFELELMKKLIEKNVDIIIVYHMHKGLCDNLNSYIEEVFIKLGFDVEKFNVETFNKVKCSSFIVDDCDEAAIRVLEKSVEKEGNNSSILCFKDEYKDAIIKYSEKMGVEVKHISKNEIQSTNLGQSFKELLESVYFSKYKDTLIKVAFLMSYFHSSDLDVNFEEFIYSLDFTDGDELIAKISENSDFVQSSDYNENLQSLNLWIKIANDILSLSPDKNFFRNIINIFLQGNNSVENEECVFNEKVPIEDLIIINEILSVNYKLCKYFEYNSTDEKDVFLEDFLKLLSKTKAVSSFCNNGIELFGLEEAVGKTINNLYVLGIDADFSNKNQYVFINELQYDNYLKSIRNERKFTLEKALNKMAFVLTKTEGDIFVLKNGQEGIYSVLYDYLFDKDSEKYDTHNKKLFIPLNNNNTSCDLHRYNNEKLIENIKSAELQRADRCDSFDMKLDKLFPLSSVRVKDLEKYTYCPFQFYMDKIERAYEPDKHIYCKRSFSLFRIIKSVIKKYFSDYTNKGKFSFKNMESSEFLNTVEKLIEIELNESELPDEMGFDYLKSILMNNVKNFLKLDYNTFGDDRITISADKDCSVNLSGTNINMTLDRIDKCGDGKTYLINYVYKNLPSKKDVSEFRVLNPSLYTLCDESLTNVCLCFQSLLKEEFMVYDINEDYKKYCTGTSSVYENFKNSLRIKITKDISDIKSSDFHVKIEKCDNTYCKFRDICRCDDRGFDYEFK